MPPSSFIEFDPEKFKCRIKSCQIYARKPNRYSRFVAHYCLMVQGVLSYVKRNPGFKFNIIKDTWKEINSFARELARDPRCKASGPSDPNQDIVKCVQLATNMERYFKYYSKNVQRLKKDHRFKEDLVQLKRDDSKRVTCPDHGILFTKHRAFHQHLVTHHPETWIDSVS